MGISSGRKPYYTLAGFVRLFNYGGDRYLKPLDPIKSMFLLVGLLTGFLLYVNRLPRLQTTDVVSVASSLVASPILKVCDPSSG